VKSQKQMILQRLKRYRTITPIQALESIGCFRLGARILELRKEGHSIITQMIKNGFAKGWRKLHGRMPISKKISLSGSNIYSL
jgi:hypothetical protein